MSPNCNAGQDPGDEHGVNIEDLATDRTAAPMSGELLFSAKARIHVPARTDPAELRAKFEQIAGDLPAI